MAAPVPDNHQIITTVGAQKALEARAADAEAKRDALTASLAILQKKMDDANGVIKGLNAQIAATAQAPAPAVKA